MDDLTRLIRDLGLTVVERRGRHLGGYRPHDRTIRITPGLRRRTERTVVAHEIAHHVLGHMPTEFGPSLTRQERAANDWAAGLLIDRERYVEVERLHDGHLRAMAHDLDVLPELVDAYRRRLIRIGDVVYSGARLGSAAWSRRVVDVA